MNHCIRSIRVALCLAGGLVLAASAAAQNAEGRRYAPGAFDSLSITGTATVRLVQGSEESVFIEGDDDAQRAVRLEVEGSTLNIHPSGSWKFWRAKDLQVVVTARDMKRIEISGAADVVAADPLRVKALQVRISGAGSVRFDKLKADKLDFNVSGAGTGTMAGAVDDLTVRISGRGAYLGENLVSQVARLSVSGAGELKVWTMKELTASVSGVATIDYWGTATVKRSNSGITTWNERGEKRP
jgi:Putative auto-transporter adhesin, head GIN domain